MLAPNAGNIGHTLPLVELLYKKMEYNVVTFSYRGYGLSTGKPSEKGIKIDAQTVLRHLADHPVIKSTKLILYGRSLGGAVAIYMAGLPQANGFVSGLILENTFLSIVKLIPAVIPFLKPFAFMCTQRWESEKIIDQIPSSVNLLILSGSKDELVPPSHPETLYNLSKAKRKYIRKFPNGTHNDTVLQPNYWTYFNMFCMKCEPKEEGDAARFATRRRQADEDYDIDEKYFDDDDDTKDTIKSAEPEEKATGKSSGVSTHPSIEKQSNNNSDPLLPGNDKEEQWTEISDIEQVKAASITDINYVIPK